MPADFVVKQLLRAGRRLEKSLRACRFTSPVTHIYNPLSYAWAPYEDYLRRFAVTPKRVVFLGMNPGPFGMVQTGVPFGEISIVRHWLKVGGRVGSPSRQHPRRPIFGFACARSEVSGRRLWGLFVERFSTPESFFAEHIVMNYCPLAFLEASGRNRTPDKLPPIEREVLFTACDHHLRAVLRALEPEWVVGIGDFAFARAKKAALNGSPKVGRIPHPSPANPAANCGWAAAATIQLECLGVWPSLFGAPA